MRIRFSPGAFIETVVALATAVLLTFAAFEMLVAAGTDDPRHFASVPSAAAGTHNAAGVCGKHLAMPHVDSPQA